MLLLGLLLLLVLLFLTPFSVEFSMLSEGLDVKPRVKFGIGRCLLALPQGMLTTVSARIRTRNLNTAEAAWRASETGSASSRQLSAESQSFACRGANWHWRSVLTALGVGGLWAMISPFLTGLL